MTNIFYFKLQGNLRQGLSADSTAIIINIEDKYNQ